MKFLITMNMSSMNGNPAHQITVEHQSQSLEEFSKVLEDTMFVVVTLRYKYKNPGGERVWEDKGKIVINSSNIGKVQAYQDDS